MVPEKPEPGTAEQTHRLFRGQKSSSLCHWKKLEPLHQPVLYDSIWLSSNTGTTEKIANVGKRYGLCWIFSCHKFQFLSLPLPVDKNMYRYDIHCDETQFMLYQSIKIKPALRSQQLSFEIFNILLYNLYLTFTNSDKLFETLGMSKIMNV